MSTRLYVGNLPYSTTSEDLANVFGQIGRVERVELPLDRMTGRSKGFAFVWLSSDGEADDAIQAFNGREMDQRMLTVNRASDTLRPPRRREHPLFAARVTREALIVTAEANEKLVEWIHENPSQLRSTEMTSRQFEELIAELWNGFGYEVELTKQTRDGGRDIVAVRRNISKERLLIECKKPRPGNKIDIRLVRELYGVKQHEKATKAFLATTEYFTRDAALLLEEHEWELEGRDFDGVHDWIDEYMRRRGH